MEKLCPYCGSRKIIKYGSCKGFQRYQCKLCQKNFSDKPRKFSSEKKREAIEMHLNNVSIKKIAKFIGCSPTSVINWIKTLSKK